MGGAGPRRQPEPFGQPPACRRPQHRRGQVPGLRGGVEAASPLNGLGGAHHDRERFGHRRAEPATPPQGEDDHGQAELEAGQRHPVGQQVEQAPAGHRVRRAELWGHPGQRPVPVEQPDRECRVALLVQPVVGHETGVADQDEPPGSRWCRRSARCPGRRHDDQGRGRPHRIARGDLGRVRPGGPETGPATERDGPRGGGLGQLASWRGRPGRDTAGDGDRQAQGVDDGRVRLEEHHVGALAGQVGESVERLPGCPLRVGQHDRDIGGIRLVHRLGQVVRRGDRNAVRLHELCQGHGPVRVGRPRIEWASVRAVGHDRECCTDGDK